MWTLKDRDLDGRIGKLKIGKKKLETPYIFPVFNPFNSEIDSKEIQKIGFKALITNAYILYKRKVKGDVHDLLKCEIVMTDSGGYQTLEYGDVEVTNKEIIEYQKEINSDIAVFLDIPSALSSFEDAKKAVEKTLERAKEAKEIIDKNRLWVCPIQGTYKELVKYSAEESKKLDFDIYALGSPTVFMTKYEYFPIFENIKTVREIIEFDKPLHLFGAGHPHLIPFAVALGIDLFDSASYILFARELRYLTNERTYKLEDLEYFPCNCPICSNYEPKELIEMEKNEKIKLLALHNLYTLKKEIESTKQAIREGRLWEYLVQKSYSHPKLREAFEKIEFNERYLCKPKQKALFIFSSFDLKNPKIRIARKKAKNLNVCDKEAILLPYHLFKNQNKKILKLYEENKEKVFFYSPYFGIIKHSLAYSFPFFQSEVNENFDKEVLEDLSREINSFVEKNFKTRIKIIVPKGLKLKIKRKRNVQIMYLTL
jgi:7-cyano-7-deazaguanine tRNA-ribosyltransferase